MCADACFIWTLISLDALFALIAQYTRLAKHTANTNGTFTALQ